MNTMKKTYLFLCLLAALCMGCSKNSSTTSTAFDLHNLQGEWLIVQLDSVPLHAEADEEVPNILFDVDNHSFACYIGCNRMGGTFSIEGDSLRLTDIYATRMYCPDKMDQEQRLGEVLEQVSFAEQTPDGNILLSNPSHSNPSHTAQLTLTRPNN